MASTEVSRGSSVNQRMLREKSEDHFNLTLSTLGECRVDRLFLAFNRGVSYNDAQDKTKH
jgi:hypothetical protein